MTEERAPRDYAEVRQALLERGYLATRLERLFLGRVADPFGSSLRGRLVSAALAGVLGGPLLGLMLAGVLVIEERGLVSLWPDAVLYAVLFAPVLGVAVALAEAFVGAVIRFRARTASGLSPRRAALAAGLIVGALFALYLGFWWVRAGGLFNGADFAALLILAIGAGFAGRIVSAAALIQATLSAGRAPRRRRPRFAGLALAAAVAVAATAAVIAGWVAQRPGPGGPVTVRPGAPERAFLIAWDGLSWELMHGLARVGAPARHWFLDPADGLAAPLLAAPGMDPAAIWMTVATGSPPRVHGVGGVELTVLAGARAPAAGSGITAGPLQLLRRLWPTEHRVARAGVRRAPAFWEVAADARRTAVVGWWATWPATTPGPAGGYLVSDGALAALRRGRGVDEAVHPAAWGASRAAGWLDEAEKKAALVAGGTSSDATHEALVTDLFAIEAARAALADPQVYVATIYLPGLDILRERCRFQGCDPFLLLEELRRHASAVDQELTDLIPGVDPADALLFLVGLPGRAGAGERGVLVARLAGEQAERCAGERAPLPLIAVAPSWLAAAGLTVDERMVGSVADWAVPRGAEIERRRTRVAPARGVAPAPELEADVLERLRSLGYVQ